jgi:CelD/BcsL family acetyltransferase involved in cellulose biosynthesis
MPAHTTENTASELLWLREPVKLTYRLGEFALMSRRFDAIRLTANFLDLTPEAAETPPASAMDAAGVAVAFANSCPVAGPLPRLSIRHGCIRYRRSQYRHYYVDLSGTFEDYLARFSPKTRSTVQRKVRRFVKATNGENYFREYRTPEEMDAFFVDARKVSEKSFQERLLGQGLPDTPEFQAELKQAAAEERVRGYILFLDSVPVSYIRGPITDDRIILYDHVGYDPKYQELSVGTVLQYFVIESLFRDGRLSFYDLCVGEGEHKRTFATDSKWCADILFFRPRPTLIVAILLHWAVSSISRAVVRVLAVLKIKARVKKLIRART